MEPTDIMDGLPISREELLEYAGRKYAKVRMLFSDSGGIPSVCDGFIGSDEDGFYVQLDTGRPGNTYRLKDGDTIGILTGERLSIDFRKAVL